MKKKKQTHLRTASSKSGQLIFLFISMAISIVLILQIIQMLMLPGFTGKEHIQPVKPTPYLIATYQGTLPCADCSGIDTTINFYSNNSYSETLIYKGGNTTFTEKGMWDVNAFSKAYPNTMVYELTSQNASQKSYFLIEPNKITQLDAEKNKISSPFPMSLRKK